MIDGVLLETCSWTYLAEGNANVVFAGHAPVLLPLNSLSHPLLDPTKIVLRVPKQGNAFTPAQQAAFRENVLIPFSARHGIELSCVSHELVHWTQALQEQLVRALHLAERPKRWQASQLNRTVKGIFLMPLIASSSSMRALEWKPKWSAQSTDAPADADFCRTCAIRAQRNGEALQEPRFCPLALTSFDDQVRARALEGLIAERRWILSLSETAGLNQFFKKTDIFKSLRHLQQQAALENMELAMTLRDCSCYLLMQDGQVVECLLADLDPKSAEKRSHWQALERGLIDGGWYYESSQAGIKKCPGLGS